jgi:hypothetical protein
MYLMMRRVFDELGYRRYEWKCDALNAPSRAAAQRLGFQYEGMFRQATVYKARNRDTCWFSILDSEWLALKARFERWLDPDNFNAQGQQKRNLAGCIDPRAADAPSRSVRGIVAVTSLPAGRHEYDAQRARRAAASGTREVGRRGRARSRRTVARDRHPFSRTAKRQRRRATASPP